LFPLEIAHGAGNQTANSKHPPLLQQCQHFGTLLQVEDLCRSNFAAVA
jgi:hypothetical protein